MPDQVTSLDGTTTIDDKMQFEPVRLSYEAAQAIAEQVAAAVASGVKDKPLVVVAGARLLADLGNLVATKIMLDGFAEDFKSLKSAGDVAAGRSVPAAVATADEVRRQAVPAPAMMLPALGAITAGAQSALALLGLFRENVDFRGVAVAIDATALELALAAHLAAHGAGEVIVPDLSVPSEPAAGDGTLRDALLAAHSERAAAWRAVAPLIALRAEAEAQLDDATTREDDEAVDAAAARVREVRRALDPISGPLASLEQRFDELQGQLTKVSDADGGLTVLARLFRAEAIRAREPIYVHIRALSAGGANRVSRSLLRTIFTGDGLSATGGIVVSWALLTATGDVLAGGIASRAHGAKFGKASRPTDYTVINELPTGKASKPADRTVVEELTVGKVSRTSDSTVIEEPPAGKTSGPTAGVVTPKPPAQHS